MLPILRTTLLGSVVAALALLAGFAAREPSRPHLARVEVPARGSLIEAAEHPEWKQFLVQAAYRRANELERLRDLPAAPTIVEPPAPAPPVEAKDQVATLSPTDVEHDAEEITGSIEETPGGAMPVEIGEASSTELPLSERNLIPPIKPETLKRQNDTQQKIPPKPRAKLRPKPPAKPAEEPDLLTRIFGPAPAR